MKRKLAFALVVFALVLAPLSAQNQSQASGGTEQAAHSEEAGHSEDNHFTLWKTANFAILAAILGFAMYKFGGAFFRGRAEEIRKGIVEAGRIKQEAEARYAAIEDRLASIGTEIEALRMKAREEGTAEQARLSQELERDLKKIQVQAEREIAAAAAGARQALRAHSAGLAVQLAEAKLRTRLTPEADAKLVESMVAGLGKQNGNRPEIEVS